MNSLPIRSPSTSKLWGELKGELTKLDNEYHVLDLVSETLVISIHRLQNEATTLEKALLHASSTNNRKRNIVNYSTSSKTVNQKNPKRIKEDEVLKRLEAALFDSDESDEEFDSDNEVSKHKNNLSETKTSRDLSSSVTIESQANKNVEKGNVEIDNSKQNTDNNSCDARENSSDSEIDEDNVLQLI